LGDALMLEESRQLASGYIHATNIAYLYYEADNFDKSEEYLRLATELEPEEPDRLNELAWLLIDKNRDLNAGLRLVDKALEVSPDNFLYLDTKGWGLYKQSKFKEALDLLQKSWDLRRQKAIYDHEAYLHLEAAKKAITNQKNN
jgi:tetratricopeptide (TPR) repeat protein